MTAYLHNEKELLRQIANDDEQAFSCLFHFYKNKIFTVAYKLTESSAMSEEAVQDIFMKLWLKRKELPEVLHFRAWFYTVARNYLYSVLKRNAMVVCREFSGVDADLVLVNDTEERVIFRETEAMVKQALRTLPPQQNRVYRLIKEMGYRKEEAAAYLKLSPETVKIHLAKAMKNIRAYCLARFDSSPVLLIALFLLK